MLQQFLRQFVELLTVAAQHISRLIVRLFHQTLHLAIARLRDEVLEAAQQGTGAVEAPYAPLTARQLLDIRSKAPQPRGRLVRRESLF